MVLDHDVLRFASRAKREPTAARHVRDANLFSALAAFSERRQTAKNDGTGLVPAGILLVGSVLLFLRGRTVGSFLQLVGAGCLVLVVLTHLCEALHLFTRMQWGSEHSVGHYLDLWSAVLGLTLFPIGYLLHALTKRHA